MINIRNAEITDAERLVEIYGYYVKNTAITFEYDIRLLPSSGSAWNRRCDAIRIL